MSLLTVFTVRAKEVGGRSERERLVLPICFEPRASGFKLGLFFLEISWLAGSRVHDLLGVDSAEVVVPPSPSLTLRPSI